MATHAEPAKARFLRECVQPGLMGLCDGAFSIMAPVISTAIATRRSMAAFWVGIATLLGDASSMAAAELSDPGTETGRGNPIKRAAVQWLATAAGGLFCTLTFLVVTNVGMALRVAGPVIVAELVGIAYLRHKFMRSPLGSAIVQVLLEGGIVYAISAICGHLGAR